VSRPTLHRGAIVLSIAIFAAIAATALASSSPKPGYYSQDADVGDGATVNVITMAVAEDATLTAAGSDPKCLDESGLYRGFSVAKPIDASNGTFEFHGKAASTLLDGPSKVKVDLKGKFTSSKHAKGSYTLEGCDGKVKFKTNWSAGG
jgi:hypothetical protein